MKLESFSYRVVIKTLELLEREHNYKISDTIKKEVAEAVVKQIDSLIEG